MKNALVVCLVAGLILSLGGLALAADDAAKEIKGTAGCAKCNFKGEDCGAAVKVGEHVFAMKPGDKASDQTKKVIASFKDAKETCEVVITGTIKDKDIIVDDIKKIEKKAEKSVGLDLTLGAVAMADDAAKEIKGTAGCAKCNFKGEDCGAAMKVGEHVFSMKPGDKASDQTKKMLESFKAAKETCEVVITGTIKDKEIIVDDIKKIEKKAPAKE